MRIVGLWNPDHHKGQTTYTNTVAPSITAPYDYEGSLAGLLTYTTAVASWQYISVYGRNWLRFQSINNGTCMVVIAPPASTGAYDAFKTAGIKRAYHGIRIYVPSYKAGGTLLVNGAGTTAYAIPAIGEYFVEVVDNLETGTRTVYVNNTTVAVKNTGWLAVGNYAGSMWGASTHNFMVADYYYGLSEDTDVPVKNRIGKMSVKTLPIATTTNDEKFTVVNATTSIAEVLNSARGQNWPASVVGHVDTDSNESKLNLLYTAPTLGDNVVGAMVRNCVIKPASSLAGASASSGGTTVNLAVGDAAAITPLSYFPLVIPKPANGWSEAELGNVVVSLNSRRLS